jgi:hypothetical protein
MGGLKLIAAPDVCHSIAIEVNAMVGGALDGDSVNAWQRKSRTNPSRNVLVSRLVDRRVQIRVIEWREDAIHAPTQLRDFTSREGRPIRTQLREYRSLKAMPVNVATSMTVRK